MNTEANTKAAKACLRPSAVTVAVTLLLTACAPTTPEWDAQFGTSVRLAISQQTIDPNAAARAPALQSMDGAAAREAMGRYRSTFKEPPPAANSFTIGVGK